MQKNKKRKYIWLTCIIGTIMSIGLIFAVIFGFFQRQVIYDEYSVAYQINGKKYEVSPIDATEIAIDKKKQNKNLYFRVSHYDNLEYLFHMAYQQYEISQAAQPKKYDGALDYNVADRGYVTQESVYQMKKNAYAIYSFHNKSGKEIYRYDPKNVSKNAYIIRVKPTIRQGYKKSELSNYDDFLNVTQLFKDKLNKKVTVKVDNKNKIILFSIQ